MKRALIATAFALCCAIVWGCAHYVQPAGQDPNDQYSQGRGDHYYPGDQYGEPYGEPYDSSRYSEPYGEPYENGRDSEPYGEPYYGDEGYGDQYGYERQDQPDVSAFHDALAPYGDWSWDNPYGWVWQPRDVPPDWQPYTYGQWVWTDAGWTWDSDEDWGWAPFHYGRWFLDPARGWCWVPGREWAPAWVAWRQGGDWVGWAPLPPHVRWRDSGGFDYVNWDRVPLRYGWSFTQIGDLPGPDIHRRLLSRARARLLFGDTRNITSYGLRGSFIINRSLDLGRVRRAYGRDIRAYRLADSPRPILRAGRFDRDRFYAYRPRVAIGPRERSPLFGMRGRERGFERGRGIGGGHYGSDARGYEGTRRFEERGPGYERRDEARPRGREGLRRERREPLLKRPRQSGEDDGR